MKFAICLAVMVAVASCTFPNKVELDQTVQAKLGKLPSNLAGSIASSLFADLQHGSPMVSEWNSELYDFIRSGVGCIAGGMDFVNTVFTDIDII